MPTRPEVYKAIDTERDYQERRWDGHQHTITEWMVYMRDYLEEGLHHVSRSSNELQALEEVRKVAALGVACMEQLGAPERPPYQYQLKGI
jgi:hypothetical protein